MNQPLKDILILELSTMVTASLASMMLAEQGARVIKVEPQGTGDPMRLLGTSKGGISGLFANCNRGKESIALDLKQTAGQDIIRKLAAKADILVHNYRPGVMEQLNLGSDSLRAANPRLIYTAISGFGTTGPLANAPAYDPVVQAQAGFTSVQAAGGTADFMRTLICDKVTAYTACQGMTAALYQRQLSGEGQHLDINMLDASLFFLWPDGFMDHTLLDADREIRPSIREAYKMHLTRDGGVTISAITDKQIYGVFRAIDREDLCDDERFSNPQARFQNLDVLNKLLKEKIASMTTSELLTRLKAEDVPSAGSLSFDEVINHPQIQANETLAVDTHPRMGQMNLLRSPVNFKGKRLPLGSHCPALGEHTRPLLKEFGFAAQLDELSKKGVISPP